MSKVTFLNLPWFAREYIYDLLFVDLRLKLKPENELHYEEDENDDDNYNDDESNIGNTTTTTRIRTKIAISIPNSLSILLTNKTIHSESYPRLLKSVPIVISSLEDLNRMARFLSRERTLALISIVSIEAVYLPIHDVQFLERRKFACVDLWFGMVCRVLTGVKVLEIAMRAGGSRLVCQDGWPGCFLREEKKGRGGEGDGGGSASTSGEEYFAGVFSNAWAFRGNRRCLVERAFLAMGRALYNWVEEIGWEVMEWNRGHSQGSQVSHDSSVELRYRIEIGCGGDPREKSVDLVSGFSFAVSFD